MDAAFGQRAVDIREAWGERGRRGKTPTSAAFSRQLGVDPRSRRIYNLEDGIRPQGGIEDLVALYEPLRKVGADPRRLASWALTGDGAMPRPAGGSRVDDISAPVPPAQPVVRGNRAEEILEDTAERALAALPAGVAEEARKILSGGLKIVRDARQLGLASIVSFAMIGASSEAPNRAAEDASSRSGGIGRRARFRGPSICPARQRTTKPKHPSSARRAPGRIIRNDDLEAARGMPKSALRENAA